MKKINIAEMIEATKNNMNDISIDFTNDYMYCGCTSYICDAISEHADSNTSIYYSDIEKFMSNNIEAVNDAISEFGWDGCGSDLHKAGQMAEYMENERLIYDDLEDVCKLAALDFLRNTEGELIAADLWDSVEIAIDADHNNRVDDLFDAIIDAVNGWKVEQAEDKNNVIDEVVTAVADVLEVGKNLPLLRLWREVLTMEKKLSRMIEKYYTLKHSGRKEKAARIYRKLYRMGVIL